MAHKANPDLIDTLANVLWPEKHNSCSVILGPVISINQNTAMVKYHGSALSCSLLDGTSISQSDLVLVLNTSDMHVILGKIKK